VQMKLVSPPRHAAGLIDDVVSPFLPLAPGVRRCSAIALRLGGALEFFGLPPSNLSPTTKLSSRHQHSHVLQGGIAEDAIALIFLHNFASGCVFIWAIL
jgi:hypothetical protein